VLNSSGYWRRPLCSRQGSRCHCCHPKAPSKLSVKLSDFTVWRHKIKVYIGLHVKYPLFFQILTLTLLTLRIWWAPNNASRWQMGFNSAFKGLMKLEFSQQVSKFYKNSPNGRRVSPYNRTNGRAERNIWRRFRDFLHSGVLWNSVCVVISWPGRIFNVSLIIFIINLYAWFQAAFLKLGHTVCPKTSINNN